jgi:hypothetical protein
VTAGTEE